jgi:hypothetical protein
MSITASGTGFCARGETNRIDIDWGENTSGQESGVLKAGDTIASCVVSVDDKPSSASDPTMGSVSANSADLYVNSRVCSAGEATTCQITTGSSQAYGKYRLKFTATTTNGYVIPRFVIINVTAP